MSTLRRFGFGSCALLLILSLVSEASAARRLHFLIELDGKVILDAGATSGDRTPTDEVWGKLEHRRHETLKGRDGYVLKADADDPLVATLRGEIRLRVMHTDRILAEAATSTLRLTRDGPGATEWFLAPGEAARTAGLAGLPPPPATPPPTPQQFARSVGKVLALILLVGLAVVVVLLVVVLRSGRGDAAPEET
ncbi:MAG: hypothetical protein OER86_07470 [Phycisphaerae bacterium]|nr:hypothetical protein [Phycisphaerae bacterium]